MKRGELLLIDPEPLEAAVRRAEGTVSDLAVRSAEAAFGGAAEVAQARAEACERDVTRWTTRASRRSGTARCIDRG